MHYFVLSNTEKINNPNFSIKFLDQINSYGIGKHLSNSIYFNVERCSLAQQISRENILFMSMSMYM